MTASEQQDISNTLLSYHPPSRPKRNHGEWIERGTRDTMPTCPPSLSSSYQLSCGTPSFSLFFFFLAETVWLLIAFTQADGSSREFLQPRLKTKSNPKSSILTLLIYISFFLNFTHNRCLVCLPVFVNHGNQASPFSHLGSPFQKRWLSHAKTSLWIQAHLKTKGRWFASIFLSQQQQLLAHLHIISEGEVQNKVSELAAAS